WTSSADSKSRTAEDRKREPRQGRQARRDNARHVLAPRRGSDFFTHHKLTPTLNPYASHACFATIPRHENINRSPSGDSSERALYGLARVCDLRWWRRRRRRRDVRRRLFRPAAGLLRALESSR